MALTRIYYHQDIQGIIPGGDDYEPIRKDFENTWKYLKSPAKGTKLDNSDAKFWKEKNFTFPNRTQLDKEKQKIPNTIVIKSSQAVIDDLIMRYHGQTNVQIKGKTHKVVQRLHKKSDADGTTEFTITYNLPLSEGLMKGPKKKTFLQAVTWRKTGKVFNSKGGRVSESTMTRIQEIGTARVLRHAMRGANKDLTTAAKIKQDKVLMKQLHFIFKKVGDVDEVDNEWLHNFAQQNKVVLDKIKRRDFQQFNREGGFMDYISEYLRKNFKITPKDNWNPADIWLIHNEAQKKRMIDDLKAPAEGQSVFKGRWRVSAKLNQLNQIFRDWFKSEELMGLSLKKVTSASAHWKVYNTNDAFFEDIGSKFLKYESSQCYMDLTDKKGVRTFASQDTRLLVRDGPVGSGTIYDFQIKANSSSGFDNLKYEPTERGMSAARMGKATVEYVENLLTLYKLTFKKSNSDSEYAKDADTFKKQRTKWVTRIDGLISKGVTVESDKYSGTKLDGNACCDKIMTVFGTQPWVANSKLMQITWLSLVLSLQGQERQNDGKDNLDEFCTDLVYLASKAGPRYGPFAKVY
tara:strand:+ start:51 stop:1775 length:1725 start_codon:yes stop_codon:yes gene_type:complete